MIYVENDWYSNFNDSVKSNDERAMSSMLADAISTLIAERRAELQSLLSKADVVIVNEPSNEQLADAIVQNLNGNNKLRVGIAYLIAKDKGVLSPTNKKYSRAVGMPPSSIQKTGTTKTPSTKVKKKIDWNKTADTVTAIANSITSITDTINQSKNGQNQFKNNIQNLSNNKAPDYSAGSNDGGVPNVPPPKKSKKWLWIGVGVTILAVVGVVGYKKGWFGNK